MLAQITYTATYPNQTQTYRPFRPHDHRNRQLTTMRPP